MSLFRFEWLAFTRSRVKQIAVIFFLLSGVFAVFRGYQWYQIQINTLEKIEEGRNKLVGETLAWLDSGLKGPESRPWVDLSHPLWAEWYSMTYLYKVPAPALILAQGESFNQPYYARVTRFSTPFSGGLMEELSNPETHAGAILDLVFVVLYLLPLLLIVFVFDIGSLERDQGIWKLVKVQYGSESGFVLGRLLFCFLFIAALLVLLLIFSVAISKGTLGIGEIFPFFSISIIYLTLWAIVCMIVLQLKLSTTSQSLSLIIVWSILCLILPGSLQQAVSIQFPTGYLIELIDEERDGRYDLIKKEYDEIKNSFYSIRSKYREYPYAKDSINDPLVDRHMYDVLGFDAFDKVITQHYNELTKRQDWIDRSTLISPVTYFEGQYRKNAGTHFIDYLDFRMKIWEKVDQKIDMMLEDSWNSRPVTRERYLEYTSME